MVDINLHKSSIESNTGQKETKVSRGFLVSISLLVIIGLVYGGSLMYLKYLEEKKVDLGRKINQESANFNAAAVNRLKDFDVRAEKISDNVNNKSIPMDGLEQMEELIIADVILDNYSNDYLNKIITISGETNDFNKVASQMLNFKKSGYFKSVDTQQTDRGEKGVKFGLEIKY